MTANITDIITQINTEILAGVPTIEKAVDGFTSKDPTVPFVNVVIDELLPQDIEINSTYDMEGNLAIILTTHDLDLCRDILEDLRVLFLGGTPFPSDALNALGVFNIHSPTVSEPFPNADDDKTDYQGAVTYRIQIRVNYT